MLHRRAAGSALTLVLVAGGTSAFAVVPASAQVTTTARTAATGAATPGAGERDLLGSLLQAVTAPLLSGLAAVGGTLTVTPPTWNLLGVSNQVQWLSNGVPVPGATGLSFVPGLEQAGTLVQAKVTGVLLGLLPVETFSQVLQIPLPLGGGGGGGGTEDPRLEAVQLPELTGIAGVGSLLQVLAPVWNLPGVSMAYQWFVGGVPVPGATGPTYVPSLEDAGKEVYARVTGTLAGLPLVSVLTGALPIPPTEASPLAASSAASLPSGAKVGRPLTVSDPTWDQDGVTHRYQWLRDNAPIAGATGRTYTMQAEDFGRSVTVKVTGSKEGWRDSTVDTNAVTPALGDKPQFSTQPSVTGRYAVGSVLTASPGAWGPGATPTYGYQWKRAGLAVPGATGATYTVAPEDAGRTLSVEVTATRPAYAPATFTTSAVEVPKLGSTTGLALLSKKVRAGKPARVRLTVEVPGLAPDGVVSVVKGKRTLKKTRIASGTRKLKLTGLEPGKHRLVAVYAGSPTTERSVSKPVVLKVVKAGTKRGRR